MTTRNEVAERYGPQTTQIEALLERAYNLSGEETKALRDAARADAWDAARAARYAARVAHRTAAWDAAEDAAQDAVRHAMQALLVRDLIDQHGFTQKHYDTLVGTWETVMGTTWTRETL